MKLMKVLAVVLLVGALASCGGLTRKDTSRWLDSKNDPSTADMTGEWDSSESLSGGWGRATFYQEGRNFSGTLGRYYAEGVVSGEEIYLVLYSGKTVYYTATLKKKDSDTYMGKAVYEEIADHKDARTAQSYLITLKKIFK